MPRKFDFTLIKKIEPRMKIVQDYVLAAGLVLGLTLIMFGIGRQTLGDAVISLLYLLPISYSAARWGQWPGICAAVVLSCRSTFSSSRRSTPSPSIKWKAGCC